MNILIVKLSSLGDVVHAMPAVQDIRQALPAARIDWVLEKSFAALAQRCQGVSQVVACELRRWRKAPLSAHTRAQWHAFVHELRGTAYDAVLDLQGLTKSALISRSARLASGGKRYALANATLGSSWEAPTRWVADVAITIDPQAGAVRRSRELCARALGYPLPSQMRWGLGAPLQTEPACVAFVHGSSREDKCWPDAHWLALGQRIIEAGFTVGLPHGSQAELARAQRLAQALGPQAQVWPQLDLGSLTDRLAGCAGVIGVDSGLSHIAVALDLPHVQIYNFDTAWRTGPPEWGPRQRSVFASPTPMVDQVWNAWQLVSLP